MNRIRYIDKKILCNYDLREEFFQELGLKITDMIPLRKVFVLFTTSGKKILKITDSTDERVEFIDKSLYYIQKSFPNVLKYERNRANEIITLWEGQKYILLEMIDGREATFSNPVEVQLCAKSLAKLHKASVGIQNELSKEELEKNTPINLIQKFDKELTLLSQIKRVVLQFKYKNEFDTIFLNIVDSVIDDLEKTKERIKNSNYYSLIKESNKIVLCHNDLAHHNFIIDNEEVSIIDFDYCNINARVMDIYNYSVKVLKSVSYDKESFDLIINSYSEISALSKDEIEVLKILMTYPRDFINISIDYYLKQKSWEEEVFISRLENKVELEEFRREFLTKL